MSLFTEADIISRYSREQAIEDGFLVAVPDPIAREAGYKHPVAISAALNAVLEAGVGGQASLRPEKQTEDYRGRLWDVLSVGMMRFRAELALDRARFEAGYTEVLYRLTFSGRTHDVYLTVNNVEGFTIMLQGED